MPDSLGSAAARQRRWAPVALMAILVVALGLRVYRLTGRSLWLDEILTSQPAHLSGPADVIAWSQAAINQMPLYYMFTWLLHPWGDGEFVLRLPAAVAGVLTVFAVFLLGKTAFGIRAGLVAALMTAVVPFAVWYSQEARNYALLMLLTTVQVYFALRSVKQGSAWDWAGLALATTLNLYTHYLALLATAAMGVFVGVFLFGELLGNAPRRAKVAAWLVIAAFAASAPFVPWRALLKYVLAHRGPTEGIAFVLLAILVFLAIVLWPRVPLRFRPRPETVGKLGLAIATGAFVAFAYFPWVPTLRIFLGRPDQSLGQIHTTHAPSFGDLVGTLAGLGLSGLTLAAFCAGLVALGFWVFGQKRVEAGLLLLWFAVPLVLFSLSARSAIVDIDIRYAAFMFPAAMLVIATGIDGLAAALERAAVAVQRRGTSQVRVPAAVASAVLVALLLVQVGPALAASYQQQKDDWRGVAQHIAASSGPGSVVLAVGAYSDWTVICLDYYFRQLGTTMTVIDGAQVNSETVATMKSGSGTVWGVVIFPSQAQLSLLGGASDERSDYTDATGNLHVIRAVLGASSTDQARTLLRWETPLEPQLSASIKLLDFAIPGRVQLGPNLAPDPASPQAWSLTPGATVDSTTVILMPGAGRPEVDASFVTGIQGGTDYLVEFDHECNVDGSQKTYAIAFDKSGLALTTFPDGSGYSCPAPGSPTRSYFAFQSPQTAATLELLLRGTAPGRAQIMGVQVTTMSESL